MRCVCKPEDNLEESTFSIWVQGLTSVRLPCPLRVSLAESLISTSPSGKMILAILRMSCVWEGPDWPAWAMAVGMDVWAALTGR